MKQDEIPCRLIYGTIHVIAQDRLDKATTNEKHKKRFYPLVTKFKDEADVWMILNHILNVMLDFAVKIHNDEMPNNDGYFEHVFRVIYQSAKQYFRKNEESGF